MRGFSKVLFAVLRRARHGIVLCGCCGLGGGTHELLGSGLGERDNSTIRFRVQPGRLDEQPHEWILRVLGIVEIFMRDFSGLPLPSLTATVAKGRVTAFKLYGPHRGF